MQREDVERLDWKAAWYVLDADARALRDRAERAEAEIVRLTADLNGLNAWVPIWRNDGKIWRDRAERAESTAEALREAGLIWAQRVGELEAERDAAFAAGQESMRERAARQVISGVTTDIQRDIRALAIKPRP